MPTVSATSPAIPPLPDPDFRMPERHVFIVTYGRSGSTLLQNLLNALPGYQIRGENNNALFHLMQACTVVRAAESLRGMRRSGKTSDPAHPWYGGERIDPDAFGAALARTFSQQVLQPDPGVRVSGFKEIRFHTHPGAFERYLDFIHTHFPGSRFVFNTRDHAAVARSGWWRKHDPQEVAQLLGRAEDLFAAYLQKHPERGIRVHYDDYNGRPEALAPLFDFLDESPDPALVQRIMDTRLTHARGDGG